MRRFLVQTNGGGICMFDRAGAVKLRDSMPKHMQRPTIEVVALADVQALVADMEEHLTRIKQSAVLTRGEQAVFASAIADVKHWFKIKGQLPQGVKG